MAGQMGAGTTVSTHALPASWEQNLLSGGSPVLEAPCTNSTPVPDPPPLALSAAQDLTNLIWHRARRA